jgi:sec-independent protein translocase protein TatB
MFGIGWSEFVVIGVVALIAIGPKELPGVLRMVGQSLGKIRRMANEFQGQFQEAMREAEMADVRKELDEISAQATDVASFDPVAKANAEMESAFADQPAADQGTTAGSDPMPAAPTPLPEISVPPPEPLPPVTDADFAPSPEPAGDLLPPSPKVPSGSGA